MIDATPGTSSGSTVVLGHGAFAEVPLVTVSSSDRRPLASRCVPSRTRFDRTPAKGGPATLTGRGRDVEAP
jgi:hypothetical protein